MMSSYGLKLPGAVYAGDDCGERMEAILREHAVETLAVFTDRGVVDNGLLAGPLGRLEGMGIKVAVLNDLPAEPSYTQVQAAVDRFRETGADMIMAVGGGSVMDAAKLAGVLATDAYAVRDLLDNPGLAAKQVKTLMLPTTAGTGAEATPNAIVAVPEQELKVGIVSDAMIPDYVILDVDLVMGLPRPIAASTGVDALAHAIECYTGNKANPMSSLFALEALDLILGNILPACDDPGAREAKRSMLLASFWAGVAIASSGTTAVHALSYPLGGKYHIAHGVSNAMLLAPVMRFNEPACREALAAAYDRCLRADAAQMSAGDKSRLLVERLEEIVRQLDIPTSLGEFNVPASDLEGLVAAGMKVTRLLDNNPRPLGPDDARALYRQIL